MHEDSDLNKYHLGKNDCRNRYNIAEILGCERQIKPQIVAYEARVLLRRLEGDPDSIGEAFLVSSHYNRVQEIADREVIFQ